MIDVLQNAIVHLGVSEIPGTEANNETIMEYSRALGLEEWIHDDETPWCALFANYMLLRSDRVYQCSARVKDFLEDGFGLRLKEPTYGCLVILDPYHVGFFVGYSGRDVLVLGGNQSNSVNISRFPVESIKEFIYCP